MKRDKTARKAVRSGDVRKDLSREQLAGIGAVALIYNECEGLIDFMLGVGLGVGSLATEITSRINGVDGKVAILKAAYARAGAPDEARTLLADTLGKGGFEGMKLYRDAIIHARAFDTTFGIAVTPPRKGKVLEVLLTKPALDGVYERLDCINHELIAAGNVLLKLRLVETTAETAEMLSRISPEADELGGLVRSRHERDIRDLIARYREHQKRRLSLAPLPGFPDIPPELLA